MALISCIAFPIAGCDRDAVPPREMEAYVAAVKQQERGNYTAALESYRALKLSSRHRRIIGKVELGIAQIEMALKRRDRALETIDALPRQIDQRPLASIVQEIEEIAASFAGTAFEDEVNDRAVVCRMAAKQAQDALRTTQAELVENLTERGEFAAALLYLRDAETLRPPADRDDIARHLLMVRERADQAADSLIERVRGLLPGDRPSALNALDDALARFRGTPAYARLIAARLELDPTNPAPAESASTAGTDGL